MADPEVLDDGEVAIRPSTEGARTEALSKGRGVGRENFANYTQER